MIDFFSAENRFLSNFYDRRVRVFGQWFSSNEHAFVYCKNPRLWLPEWNDLTPGQVKRKGREDDFKLAHDWGYIKVGAMFTINTAKYVQHADLRERLLATRGHKLVEGNNWHDTFWGVCNGCRKVGDHEPIGENHLGQVLMALRARLA